MQVYKILFHTQYAHAINLIDTISISFPSCSIRNTHSTIILPLKKITNNINLTFHNCNKVLNVITLLSSLQTYNYNITEYISSTSYAPTSTDKQDPHARAYKHTQLVIRDIVHSKQYTNQPPRITWKQLYIHITSYSSLAYLIWDYFLYHSYQTCITLKLLNGIRLESQLEQRGKRNVRITKLLFK